MQSPQGEARFLTCDVISYGLIYDARVLIKRHLFKITRVNALHSLAATTVTAFRYSWKTKCKQIIGYNLQQFETSEYLGPKSESVWKKLF